MCGAFLLHGKQRVWMDLSRAFLLSSLQSAAFFASCAFTLLPNFWRKRGKQKVCLSLHNFLQSFQEIKVVYYGWMLYYYFFLMLLIFSSIFCDRCFKTQLKIILHVLYSFGCFVKEYYRCTFFIFYIRFILQKHGTFLFVFHLIFINSHLSYGIVKCR